MEHINEPSPYDHLQNMNTDIFPYLLVFFQPILNMGMSLPQMGTIASDSCAPPQAKVDLSNEVLTTMTQAMNSLTTSTNRDQTRIQIRNSLLEVTNDEGNKLVTSPLSTFDHFVLFSIIHIAASNKQVEALKLIIDMVERIDISDVLDEPNQSGSTALHIAAEQDHLDAVR